MQDINKKVCNMSVSELDAKVEYPKKESAKAYRPHGFCPFEEAIIGVTYPFAEYHIERNADLKINVFELVLKGEGEIRIGDTLNTVKAGDIYILRAGEKHSYRSHKSNPMHKIWINYTADYMSSFLDSYGISSGVYRSLTATKYFERLYNGFLNDKNANSDVFEIAKCVNNIVSTLSAEKNSTSDSDAHLIRRILDGCVYSTTSLDEVAGELHMSKSNIIRIFKKEYGITPYNYLVDLKIEASKILLESTHMTVREIADKIEIYDAHYFSNLFFDRTGKRPRDYRNEFNKQLKKRL